MKKLRSLGCARSGSRWTRPAAGLRCCRTHAMHLRRATENLSTIVCRIPSERWRNAKTKRDAGCHVQRSSPPCAREAAAAKPKQMSQYTFTGYWKISYRCGVIISPKHFFFKSTVCLQLNLFDLFVIDTCAKCLKNENCISLFDNLTNLLPYSFHSKSHSFQKEKKKKQHIQILRDWFPWMLTLNKSEKFNFKLMN